MLSPILAKHSKLLLYGFIPLVSFLLHLEVFTLDLCSIHVWRQTQTQQTVLNFASEDFNILNPRKNERVEGGDGIFRMEFPVMQWVFAAFYKTGWFGNGPLISRILSFIIGLFSAWGMYRLVFNLSGRKDLGLIGAWALTFSPAFFYYTVSPMPDNFALCAAIWGTALIFDQHRKVLNEQPAGNYWSFLLGSMFLSLAALAKLPFIVFYAIPFVHLIQVIKDKKSRSSFVYLLSAILFTAPVLWYAWVIPTWNNGIVSGITDNSTSLLTLMDYLQHNLISTLPELLLNFAAVPVFIMGLAFLVKERRQLIKNLRYRSLLLVLVLCMAYYFFEINMIAKIHDYYLFPFLPLLFLVVTYGAMKMLDSDKPWLRNLVIIGLLAMPVFTMARMHTRWNVEKPGFNADLYKYKTEIRSSIPEGARVAVGNDSSPFIWLYYVNRNGLRFTNNEISLERLQKENIDYVITDSEAVKQMVLSSGQGKMVNEFGSIEVIERFN